MLTQQQTLPIVIVIIVLLILIAFTTFRNKEEEFCSNFKDTKVYTDKQFIPETQSLSSVSANNVLTFTGNNVCDGKVICNTPDDDSSIGKVCWDRNHDCHTNYEYLKNMCVNRRYFNKAGLCNSTVGINPRPQSVENPDNFYNF